MSTPAPLDPKTPSNENPSSAEAVAPGAPSFEVQLRDFWAKHSRTVYALCAVVLLAILARGAFEYYEREKEAGIRADYAAAKTPEALKTFVRANENHTLSGVASLSLADDAYRSGNYAEALTQYKRASEILGTGVLAGRARLGVAISQLGLGQSAEGEEALRKLANDVGQLNALRGEAAYHLAMLALDGGRTDEAIRYLDQAASVDQAGIWAQRAMMTRATLPAPAAPAPAPEVSVKAPATP